MRPDAWTLRLADGEGPLHERLAAAIAEDVRRGRLPLGTRLPGSREVAKQLGLARNTVIAAFAALEAEGWIAVEPRRGAFVATAVEAPPPRPTPVPEGPTYAFEARTWTLDPAPRYALDGGAPDLTAVPVAALARAWRRGLQRRATTLLDYGDPRGLLRLRAALAPWLAARRGLAADPDQVIVTRGSQMGLYLTARALLRPGDRVAVESFGYPPAWEALRRAGATLVPVPVDGDGLDVAALAALPDLRAVYLTPHHQFPTLAVLSPGRRAALLALAAARGWVLIEDDYDHELHYEGRPVLPLASAGPRSVVYVGTLSKVIAPGLRLGWVVAPRPVVDALAAERVAVDRQGDQVTEQALAELLEDGEVERHLRRMRRRYRERRDAVVAALRHHLGHVLTVEAPVGGMALWPRIDPSVDVEAWAERSRRLEVRFAPGRRYDFFDRPQPHARMGFARLAPDALEEAVRRLARAL